MEPGGGGFGSSSSAKDDPIVHYSLASEALAPSPTGPTSGLHTLIADQEKLIRVYQVGILCIG